jgi:hypothetical protein
MALLFKNTYSPDFYKQLHHFIHKLYRQKRAEKRIKEMSRLNDIKKLLAWPFYRASTKRSLSKLRLTEPDVNFSI